MSRRHGFSLMETLFVVAIIGILAALGLPQYNRWKARSVQAQVKQELTSLYTSQRSFKEEYKTFHWHLPVTGFVPPGIARAANYPVQSGAKRYYGISIFHHGTAPTLAALGLAEPGGFVYNSGSGYRSSNSLCEPTGDSGLENAHDEAGNITNPTVSPTSFLAVALGCPLKNVQVGSDNLDIWTINQDREMLSHRLQN